MNDISAIAYSYAALIFGIAAAYFWYLFYSLGIFLGKNYLPQNVSSIFSIQNSNFPTVCMVIASLLTIIIVGGMALNRRLREYVIDVGDELSRVSWPPFQEAQKTTGIVIVVILVAAFVLFLADMFFMKLVNLILGTAG